MRRWLIALGFAALAGGALYQVLAGTGGFVLVSAGNYVVETSLWMAALMVVAVVVLVVTLLKARRLIFLPKAWLADRSRRRQRKYRDRSVRGLLHYLEGNWPAAARSFGSAAGRGDMAEVNILGAASATFNAGDWAGAREWLHRAEESGAADQLAAGLLKTRLYLLQGDFDRALGLVRHLHSREPDHPTVLRLLASAYKGVRDWPALEALLPDIRKAGALSEREFEELQKEVYEELILAFPGTGAGNASASDRQQDLDQLWDDVPRRLQKDNDLVACYVRQLARLGRNDKAEARLRRHLGKHWDDDLAELYGGLHADPVKQLEVAEGWVARQPDNPRLMRILGNLSCRNQLWGKARDYYERSLRLLPDPETYLQYGQLLSRRDDRDAALESFRRGLSLKTAASSINGPGSPVADQRAPVR